MVEQKRSIKRYMTAEEAWKMIKWIETIDSDVDGNVFDEEWFESDSS